MKYNAFERLAKNMEDEASRDNARMYVYGHNV